MIKKELKISIDKSMLQQLLSENEEFMKPLIQSVVQEVLEAQMSAALGADKGERTAERLGYRSGSYTRWLITRVGRIELRVPQDRQGRFSTEVFERYQRSEKALVSSIIEMYVQGVSTRKVKKVAEQLCGYRFSASTVSRLNRKLDGQLARFSGRRLHQDYPYLIVDARYERVREDGVIGKQAVLIALGISWEGRREVLGVELANRESHSSWREFLIGLKKRGLSGVQWAVSDNHEGLKKALSETLPQAAWQRCYVHFLRNAVDHLPRKADDDCLTELRWLYDRRDLQEARRDLHSWIERWADRYPKLCTWVEDNIEETFTFYRLPRAHRKHLKSTNMLERLNQEIKRRTQIVRIFPNAQACLRLVRALAVEIHEDWIEAHRYLNMDTLNEHLKLTIKRKSQTA